MAAIYLTQINLYKLLNVYLLFVLFWNTELLSNFSIRLVKTVYVRCWYPKY